MKLFQENEVIPIGNIVVLQRDDAREKSDGGLWLAPNAKEKSLFATVLAVGPGQPVAGLFVQSTVKVGDTVLVDKIGGFELEFGEEKYLVVREPEIIAIIRGK